MGHRRDDLFRLRPPRVLRDQHAARWEPFAHEELYGRKIVIVGFGDIGQAVGQHATAFGMQVTPIRRNHQPEDLIRAIEAADYIVIDGSVDARNTRIDRRTPDRGDEIDRGGH